MDGDNLIQNISTLETYVCQLAVEIQMKRDNEVHLNAMLEQSNGWTTISREAVKRAEAAESESQAARAAAIKLSTERDTAVRQVSSLKSQIDIMKTNEFELKKMIQNLETARNAEEVNKIKTLSEINRLQSEKNKLIDNISKYNQNLLNVESEFGKLFKMQKKLENEIKAASTLHNQQSEEGLKLKLHIKNLESKLNETVNENILLKLEIAEIKKSMQLGQNPNGNNNWCSDCRNMFKK